MRVRSCVCERETHVEVKDNLWESVLSFHRMSSWDLNIGRQASTSALNEPSHQPSFGGIPFKIYCIIKYVCTCIQVPREARGITSWNYRQ